jgi:hypothetical protein
MPEKRLITLFIAAINILLGCRSHGAKVLTDRIKGCQKHSMRDMEQKVDLLRSALIGLVGSNDIEELNQMEAAFLVMPASEEEKVNSINAIHAIIKTSTEGY